MNVFSVAVLMVAVLAPGCSKEKEDVAAKGKASEPASAPPAKKASAAPPQPKIVACDQRDFAPKARPDTPKRVCVDYSKHTGPLSPSCMQGKPLDSPCPTEDVLATCSMKTGSVFMHYAGADIPLGKRLCKTIEGVWAENK